MVTLHDLDLSSPAAFLIVAGLALIDGVIPLVPARTAVIGLGVVAGRGDTRAYPLLVVATVAAFVGDNISYWLGARMWPRISRLVLRGPRTRRVWSWMERQLQAHGTVLVALARVVPGGPTPITLSAGSTRMPLAKFRIGAAASASLWSAYAFAVGALGDVFVSDNLVYALLAALGLAVVLNFALRLGLRRRWSPTAETGDTPATNNAAPGDGRQPAVDAPARSTRTNRA